MLCRHRNREKFKFVEIWFKSDKDQNSGYQLWDGLNTNKMAEAGYNIYGVDLSPTAIEKFNEAGLGHPLRYISPAFFDYYFDGVLPLKS